jgi:hypothetical protein
MTTAAMKRRSDGEGERVNGRSDLVADRPVIGK